MAKKEFYRGPISGNEVINLWAPTETKEATLTRLSRYLLPAVLVLVALVALPAGAQVINTYPGWNGTDTISAFGYPNTSTYGEAITTPAGATNVSQFSFYLKAPAGFQFQAFIAPWDNNNYLIPGGLAGVSYLSPVITVTNPNLVQYTVNSVNLPVTPGTIYMFGITIDNVYDHDAQYGTGSMGGDVFSGGNSTYYFAWNNDSGNGTLLGQPWNNEGCANNGGSCGQAAWNVTYSGVTSQSAFEMWNRTGSPADEFQEFFGGIDPSSVIGTYNGDYPHVTITGVNGGTLIDWTGGATPNGTYSHFGISFSGNVNMLDATAAWYDQGVQTATQAALVQVWDPKAMELIDVLPGDGTPAVFSYVQRRVPPSPSGNLGLSDLFRDGTLWNSATLIDPDFVLVSRTIRALLYAYPPPGPGQWDVMMYDVLDENRQLIETYGNAISGP